MFSYSILSCTRLVTRRIWSFSSPVASPLGSRLFVARTYATAGDRPSLESRVAALEESSKGAERDSKGVLDALQDMEVRLAARLDAMGGQLDANTMAVQDVDKRLTGVEGRLTGVEGRLTGVEGQLKDFKVHLSANTRSIEQLSRKSLEMAAGMGVNFERSTAVWVEALLLAEDPALGQVKLEHRKKFADKAMTVNPKSQEFEVDLFSMEPGVIVEATTYLRREERDKCEKLVRIRDFLEREFYPKHFRVFLACVAVDPEISKEVEDFCRVNGIELKTHTK